MPLYWNIPNKLPIALETTEAVGREDIIPIYIKHVIDRVDELPTCDSKYIKNGEDGFPVEMSAEEKALVDAEELVQAKTNKISALSIYCRTLINSTPVTYDGVQYGCTEIDQSNWTTLANMLLMAYKFGATDEQLFPIVNEVKDWNGDYISMPSFLYINNIIMAGKNHVFVYRSKLKYLRDQVLALTNLQDVLDFQVEDNPYWVS